MRYKRQTLQDMTKPLKSWLYKHRENPYPTKAEKLGLAADSNMTLTQVSNWFANARRRLKNTVGNPDLSWGKRVKMYNSCVKGNQELLSISSDDSAWESGEDVDKLHETSPTGRESVHSRLSSPPGMSIQGDPFSSYQCAPSPSMLPLNLSRHESSHHQNHHQQQHILSHSIDSSSLPVSSGSHHSDHHYGYKDNAQQFAPSQGVGSQTTAASGTNSSLVTAPNSNHHIHHPHLHQRLQSQPLNSVHHPHPNTIKEEESVAANEEESPMEQSIEEQLPESHNKRDSHGSSAGSTSGFLPSTNSGIDEQPSKFKNSILQRYLQDSYQNMIQLNPVMNNTRHRNPSGSLSSHDYEDLSVSSRSTPTKEIIAHDDHNQEYEELFKQWPQLESKASEELHWKEISAALALTALSRGDFKGTPAASSSPSTQH